MRPQLNRRPRRSAAHPLESDARHGRDTDATANAGTYDAPTAVRCAFTR